MYRPDGPGVRGYGELHVRDSGRHDREAGRWSVRESGKSPSRDTVMPCRGQGRSLHVKQQVRRRCRARGRKQGLHRRVACKVAVHGGAVIPSNGLIQGSRDVYEPLVFEVARFSGKVLIILSGHEAGLI